MEQKDKRVGVKGVQTEQKFSIVHRSQNPRPLKGSTAYENLKFTRFVLKVKILSIRRLYSPVGVGGW